MKSLVIGAVAGPGSGKSTFSGGVFNVLKEKGYNVEYVQEFAKSLTWEKNFEALKHQEYVTCTQQYMQNVLNSQVQAIITDSPIIIGLMYYQEKNKKIRNAFTKYILESFKSQNNLTFFIERVKKYNPIGRNQTEEEAIKIDNKILDFLKSYNIPYISIPGSRKGLNQAITIIEEKISSI